jgi:hypothetical protein
MYLGELLLIYRSPFTAEIYAKRERARTAGKK